MDMECNEKVKSEINCEAVEVNQAPKKLLDLETNNANKVDVGILQSSVEKTLNDVNVDDEKIEKEGLKSPEDCVRATFKKPVLIIGPRKGHPTKLKTLPQGKVSTDDVFTSLEQLDDSSKKDAVPPSQPISKSEIASEMQKEMKKTTVPYTEPSWSGKPEEAYRLEVLKSGVILDTIDITDKNYHVVGRLPICDIPMAHPTISRYHAIFQYRAVGDEKNGKGLYVYDLESTHGTFWNGNRIRPKVYVRLQGGHMVKFGCSQRKFIVKAPQDDQEQESEYSVTELKEMRKLEIEERERLDKLRLEQEEEEERLRQEKEENEGVSWGMGEDADEETDLTENPYAQTNNEDLFLNDPKKTLRGWFEREGHDLQYNTEDKGVGKFLCWVELPIEVGRIIRAEALVTGKKKEAVVQCALEACRIIDRYGLLRQANHEGRKRKSRNWEEEDFYDSDEDNFLDRTGTVEKKREQRMKMAGKLETKAETYESLLEKHSQVTDKITKIENTIALYKSQQNEDKDSNVDALDAFMSTLDSAALDKTEIRKMKIELLNLRKEEMQLLKLINIAKPANLPPLKPHVPIVAKKSKIDTKDSNINVEHKKETKRKVEDCTVETKKKDESCGKRDIKNKKATDIIDDSVNNMEEIKLSQEAIETDKKETETKSIDAIQESINMEDDVENDTEESEQLDKESLKKKKRNMKRNQQRLEKATKEFSKGYDQEQHSEDYNLWVPPQDQSGDGRTSLNDKFGY